MNEQPRENLRLTMDLMCNYHQELMEEASKVNESLLDINQPTRTHSAILRLETLLYEQAERLIRTGAEIKTLRKLT